ncbi:hypothetical protein [Polynucleobacter sp.]
MSIHFPSEFHSSLLQLAEAQNHPLVNVAQTYPTACYQAHCHQNLQ